MAATRTTAAMDGVLDELDTLGVSDERMKDLQRSEFYALHKKADTAQISEKCGDSAERASKPYSKALPRDARDFALLFMRQIVDAYRLPESSRGAAQVLLDAYTAQAEDAVDGLVLGLPSLCISLVGLMTKLDSIKGAPAPFQRFAYQQGAEFAKFLRSRGYSVEDPIENDLPEYEKRVLKVMAWQVRLSSAEDWTQMFCSRFNILTRRVWESSCSWIQQRSGVILIALARLRPTSEAFPPHMVATGLFGLRLVSARLLPAAVLKPKRISDADWADTFKCLGDALPAQASPLDGSAVKEHIPRLLQFLTMAVGMGLPDVLDAVDVVSEAVRELAENAAS
mmetsp:Transcript_80708/g.234056  ORF Transcript_80708/g.234056 Transcript_80708/m.234056 type:complete len:339 (+) Transcript_80708:86-1102(+)